MVLSAEVHGWDQDVGSGPFVVRCPVACGYMIHMYHAWPGVKDETR